MKRRFYIFLFSLLGILVSTLIHATIEIWYIRLLILDFSTYSLGISWNGWILAHHVASVILLCVGFLVGYFQGKYWWKRLYEKF